MLSLAFTGSSGKYEAWKTLPPLPDDHPLANNHTLLVAGANDPAEARKDGSRYRLYRLQATTANGSRVARSFTLILLLPCRVIAAIREWASKDLVDEVVSSPQSVANRWSQQQDLPPYRSLPTEAFTTMPSLAIDASGHANFLIMLSLRNLIL